MNRKHRLIAFVMMIAFVTGAAEVVMPPPPAKQPDLVVFRPPLCEASSVVDGFLWVEAENFTDYGDWKLDTQFIHKMGSAYLLACGVGTPIGMAET